MTVLKDSCFFNIQKYCESNICCSWALPRRSCSARILDFNYLNKIQMQRWRNIVKYIALYWKLWVKICTSVVLVSWLLHCGLSTDCASLISVKWNMHFRNGELESDSQSDKHWSTDHMFWIMLRNCIFYDGHEHTQTNTPLITSPVVKESGILQASMQYAELSTVPLSLNILYGHLSEHEIVVPTSSNE